MIRIWKIGDNGTVTVATDCTTPEDFESVLSDAIVEYVETAYPQHIEKGEIVWPHDLNHDMTQIISGAFQILCKLKGYKCERVGEQRLLYSGHVMPQIQDGFPCVECK